MKDNSYQTINLGGSFTASEEFKTSANAINRKMYNIQKKSQLLVYIFRVLDFMFQTESLLQGS